MNNMIKINTKSFNANLKIINSLISKKDNITIRNFVNDLQVIATDNVGYKIIITEKADMNSSINISANGKQLIKIFSGIKSEFIAIEQKETYLHINNSFAIECDIPEYIIDNNTFTTVIEMNKNIFDAIIDKTNYIAIAKNEHLFFQGTHLNFESNKLTGCATDGSRINVIEETTEIKQDAPLSLIIHKDILNFISKIHGYKDLIIAKSNKNYCFIVGNIIIEFKPIDAKYPDYKKVIPLEFNYIAEFNKLELINIIKNSLLVNTDKLDCGIIFNISNKEKCIIYNADETLRNEMNYNRKTINGLFSIRFNAKFLLDILKITSGATITMNIYNDITPIVFTDTVNENNKHIVMPQKI
jgi:DNA polymerase-3 subunit beta